MDNFDLRKYLAEGRLLKEDKPAGYYNAATITSHSDYYDIIITNKEEFFKIQKDPDSFMGEEAEEYLVDLEPGMYQMIFWNDEGPGSMGFDSKLDYVKESIRNFWGEDHFEEKFGIGDILDAAGNNWESAFHKHIEDNLDKYYEELNSLIKNSYPDKDSANGVVLLVNGKEVAGADNGRLTNMLGTAYEIKRDLAEGRLLKEQLMPKKISNKPFTIIYQTNDMSDYEAYDELLSDREQDLATGDMGDKFAFDSNTPADEIEDYLMPETPEEGNKKLERFGLSKYWKY